MSEAIGSWVDGREATTLPLDDRGLQYGDGLFETVLVRAGKARFLESHLARLTHGLTRLGIAFAEMPALRADIDRAVTLAPPLAVLKIIVTRGSAPRRGYAPSTDAPARRIVTLWPTQPLAVGEGVAVRIARVRVADQPLLAGVKHLNRLENVLAAAEPAEGSCFESLLLDARGRVLCGISSNVFLVRAGELVTPPVDRAGVAGVMRAIVLREAARLDIPVRQEAFLPGDLTGADGMFITNARIGVVPVRRVGEHAIGMTELVVKLRGIIEALDA